MDSTEKQNECSEIEYSPDLNNNKDLNKFCNFCTTKSELYCKDCQVYICDDCKAQHDKFPVLKNHVVKSISSEDSEPIEYPQCKTHGRDVDIYCVSCRAFVCLLCFQSMHNKHEMELLTTVFEKEKVSLQENIDWGLKTCKRVCLEMGKIDEDVSKSISLAEWVKEEISRAGDKEKLIVDAAVSKLQNMIEKKIKKVIDQADISKQSCISLKRSSESIIETCRKRSTCLTINELISNNVYDYGGEIETVKFHNVFDPTFVPSGIQVKINLGYLTFKDLHIVAFPFHSIDTTNFSTNILHFDNDKLVILSSSPSTVQMYDLMNWKVIHSSNHAIPGFTDFALINDKLYTTAAKNLNILDLVSNTNEQLALNYAYAVLFKKRNNNILLTSQNKLYEYNVDTKLNKFLRCVPPEITSINHAVQTTDDQYVLCGHGTPKICIVNEEGVVTNSFNGHNESGSQIQNPIYMAIDEDKNIYVADSQNSSVIVLDEDLNWITALRLAFPPYRICVNNSKKILGVAYDRENHVDFFKIMPNCKN